MKILVGKATVEISSEGPDVSLGTELVAYCTHLLHLKPQQRILKRCESVNDEDNIGGDSMPELLRVNLWRKAHRYWVAMRSLLNTRVETAVTIVFTGRALKPRHH